VQVDTPKVSDSSASTKVAVELNNTQLQQTQLVDAFSPFI
jgi:hypothetical protein